MTGTLHSLLNTQAFASGGVDIRDFFQQFHDGGADRDIVTDTVIFSLIRKSKHNNICDGVVLCLRIAERLEIEAGDVALAFAENAWGDFGAGNRAPYHTAVLYWFDVYETLTTAVDE